MDLETQQKLVKVVKSIRGTCIGQQRATQLIGELIALSPIEGEPLPYLEQIEGVKDLTRMGLIPQEEALLFVKRLTEESFNQEMRGAIRHKGSLSEKENDGARRGASDKPNVVRFGRGELREALIAAVRDGFKTINEIVRRIEDKHAVSGMHGSISGRLAMLTEEGIFDRHKNADGLYEYSILQFDSAEQAGVKVFQSVKEVEAELKS